MASESDQTIRSSMGFREEVLPILHQNYASALVDWIKNHRNQLITGNLTFCLAGEFGFCYGVDKAIELAYEAVRTFPGKRIFLTSEIIHNPQVNAKLREQGILFLTDSPWRSQGFSAVQHDDVVIIPAFGTTVHELGELQKIGCTLVDTTCGSVVHVWKRVEKYAKDGFTALVHGKYDHEETRATCSRATKVPGGKFLVVRDLPQTQKVCNFILGRATKEELLSHFSEKAYSKGFDPGHDLARIGCANQTTTLSKESLQVADLLQQAMKDRYGEQALEEHFRHFDTICSATQERQDAVMKLIKKKLDFLLVIGGYNSSNTCNLVEMASEYCAAYHIQDASDILSIDEMRHQPPYTKVPVIKKGWISKNAVKIGVTAGASTPNKVIEEVIQRVISVTGNSLPPLQ